jgi:iron complex transport system substrate-binding protein
MNTVASLFSSILLWSLCSSVAAASITLLQADGTELILERPADRIITLSPHLAELAFAAGVGERLLATVEYSNFPPAAEQLPRVGDAFRVDLERVMSLKPDLVIAWQSGNPALAVSRLQELGFNTWVVEIRRPEEIAGILGQMGAAGGEAEAGQQAAQQSRLRLQQIQQAGAGKPRVSYFYQVAERPLFTLNGEHLVSQSLTLCGGENIFAEETVLAPQVSLESVIVKDPEVIFAPRIAGQPDPLVAWQQWPRLRAVKQQRLYELPADEISRASPRLLDAVAIACNLLHQATRTND